MPRFPGLPERRHYNSVKAYLSELAKDIAEMVVDPVKMECFRDHLKRYANFWKQWSTFDEANRQGCWVPSMGRAECVFNIFSRSYNPLNEIEKEAKRLTGSYALCALIHDTQLPHLDKINTDIIPAEAIEETLSAPRNTLEDRLVGNWNSGPDVREIYLIEDFFNMVNVDLQEFCKSEENKLTQASIEGQIQQARQLSDEEFLELTAKKFEERVKKILAKDETWHDLNRLLKGWFDAAVERLKKLDFKENKIGVLKYHYKNLLHYTRGIDIKSFRGFRDPRMTHLASNQASELAARFKDFAQRVKVSAKDAKEEIVVISKENEFGTIVGLLQKDYLLENEDDFKQKIAEIVQDFISRGLANSTACVSKQLQVHFEHNNKLIDHIIESLKHDFAGIPLANFKEKLFAIVDEEYKKSIPLTNSYLVKAGLAQRDMLSGYENTINNKKEKLKETIETRLAISEKQGKATSTSQSDGIVGDTWSILGVPINIKKLRAKLKSRPFLLYWCLLVIFIIVTYPLWHPLINKTEGSPTTSTNIFADVSKDGSILRSNKFPWKIKKTKDRDGNILYTLVDRRGDSTAISVVPDNPKYTVYQSYDGMVIKFTCAEEEMSNFTIKLKY